MGRLPASGSVLRPTNWRAGVGLKSKLKEIAMGRIAAYVLKNAAEGAYGAQVKSAYWFLAGKKTLIGTCFGVAWAALLYLNTHGGCGSASCDSIASWVETVFGWLTAAGLAVGQLDGALRHDAPRQ